MTRTYPLPQSVQRTLQTLTNAGFHAYVVGGAVRDVLRGEKPKDWDIATSARPENILKLFPHSHLDNEFGTVSVPMVDLGEEKRRSIVEITPFRKEGIYKDFRRPTSVTWGKTIEDDLSRRDFTINAIALAPTGGLVDPFDGQVDLEYNTIRTVGIPEKRFEEDALRLLRAIRLHVELAFTIEPATLTAIKALAHLLQHISGQRIHDELMFMMTAPPARAADGIYLMREVGVLDVILPELDLAFAQPQARHHKWNVGKHSVESLRHCPSSDPIVRFATLLHDIGKPAVADRISPTLITFYNHEVVGVPIARRLLNRLRFSKKDRDRILNLIRWHQFSVDEHITDAAIRRFIKRIGVDNVNDIIDLRIGDRLGGGCREAQSWRLKLFRKRIWEVQHPPPNVTDLAIDGTDIMQVLGIKPGPEVGAMLNALFEETIDDPDKNNRAYLLKRVAELKKT